MNIIQMMQPLIESIGFPAVIFMIWFIYHRSQVKTFETIIKNNFEILREMVETNQYHGIILSRLESKIDSNHWCPMVKKEVC